MTVYGLINSDNSTKVPLHSIDVRASIQGFIANVETDLLYENSEDEPIEASFIFPLDDNSAVHKFEAVIDGRLIIGECQGKEQARQTYDDAIAAGDTAFLMEEDDSTGDVFECKVGNLPPHTFAQVKFTFVTHCKVQNEGECATTFVYPCVLGPRYTPTPSAGDGNNTQTAQDDSNQPSTSSSSKNKNNITQKTPTYSTVEDIPYSFSATINYVCKGSKVDKVWTNASKGDKTKITKHDSGAKVIVSSFQLDQDLEVRISHLRAVDYYKPRLYLEKGDKTKDGLLKNDVAMLQFRPNMDELVQNPSRKGEYIFVLDRSGSMMGDRITQATKALTTCLEMLPDDCYFNVVSFGSNHSALIKNKLIGRSVKNSKTVLSAAIKTVSAMDADMGGTEMKRPLEWIYTGPCIPDYPKQIILLTDGAVWGGEIQEMLKLVSKNAKHTRVFTFGIGFGVSTSLIRGLARAGNGKCDFIKEDMHKMKSQVASILNCAMSEAVQNVKLDVKKPGCVSSHIIIPTELPPIFLGEDFITFAMLTRSDENKNKENPAVLSYTLTGEFNGKKLKYKLEGDLNNITAETFEAKDLPIHRLAAKAQIKELEDNDEKDQDSEKKITLISMAANIMSRYTSFVGVDKGRVEKVKGKAKRVDIPLPKLTEKKDRQKQPSMNMMKKKAVSYGGFAMAASAPRQYGGAGPDAPQAAKYIGGKVPDIPGMDSHKNISLSANASKSIKTEKNSIKTTCEKLEIEINETPVEVCEEETELYGKIEDNNHETATEIINENEKPICSLPDGSSGRNRKRKSANGMLLTHKKCRRVCSVSEGVFALWGKDGYYYYATPVKSADSNKKDRIKREMRFKDGVKALIHQRHLLSSKLLSPGDVVSIHNNKENYVWGIVLEYTAKSDNFLVAHGDGIVTRCCINNIVIPSETALVMMDRPEYDSNPKRLVKLTAIDGIPRELTTSDLAELHPQGWINENIVAFWHSKVLPAKINKPELFSKSYIFPPQFFLTLTDSLQMDEDFLELPPELQSIIIERQWRSYVLRSDKWKASKTNHASYLLNGVDLTEKELLFFPMYDDLHWYVILAYIKEDELDKNVKRASFFTMDSYYKASREYETTVLKRFLTDHFNKHGQKLAFNPGVYQYHVPTQGNDWDCGLCTLQCIEQTYQENLKPKPHLMWFYQEDLAEKRQEIAKHILDAWEK